MNHYTPTKKSVKAVRKNLTGFIEEYESYPGKAKRKTPKLSIFIDDISQIKAASGFDLKRIYFDGNCHYNNPQDYFDNIKETLKKGSLMASPTEFVWVLSSFITEEEAIKCNEIVKELENEGIMAPHVQIRYLADTGKFQIVVFGKTKLNGKELEVSQDGMAKWYALANNSKIFINDEISVKFEVR
jgi:putative protease